MPTEPFALDPYFTFEDLREVRDTIGDSFDKDATFDYTIAPITDMVSSLDAASMGPSAPGTPGGDSRAKSRRKMPTVKREIRNLYTDSKSTRKWERLEMIGASNEYREFVRQMENIVNTLKDSKPHCTPFLKPLKDSEAPDYKDYVETPMDLSTLGRNLDNMLYWTSSAFEKDVNLIFSNAKTYFSEESEDSAAILEHAYELETIASNLLSGLSESDFSSERESLRDVLSQVLPDVHPAPESGFEDAPVFDPQADALKRFNFFKEDPSFTHWRQAVKSRLEADSSSETSKDSNDSTPPSSVSPDPLFALPQAEFLPSQWRVAYSPIYSSLSPESPLVRPSTVSPLANGTTVLPACAALRLSQLISHRNSVLLQRVKAHTAAHGLSPLDPNVERPIPPPESNGPSSVTDEPRINLIEPSIRLVMPPPPSTSPGPMGTNPDGTPIQTTGKAPAKMGQNIKMDPDASVNDEDDAQSEAPPPIIPFFSDENMTQADPIYDDVPLKHDPSTLTNTRLDDDGVAELLRQTVGVQLALAGYQASHDSAVNVLTDVVAGFIRRIGFAANTYLSAPGTLETLPEIMNRTISEVFPRGIQSIKSFTVSETMKSDNCLRLVDPSTMLGWVEASPTLSPCLNPPAHASKASSSKNPQKLVSEAVLTQLIREDKLDEKASRLGETREFFLQQAPFAKRTPSYYAYKPLAYIGSTSSSAVGTPGGLHLVLPPNAHPMDAEAKAQAAAAVQRAASMAHSRLPTGAVPPTQQVHMSHAGMQMGPGPHGHVPMQGLPPQQVPGSNASMPPNGTPQQPMMAQRPYVSPPGQPAPPGHGASGNPLQPQNAHAAPRMPPGATMPPGAAPKKGPVPGNMGYGAAPVPQGMPAGYPPAAHNPQRAAPYPPHMANYPNHPGMSASPHMSGNTAVPPGAKKTAAPPAAKPTAVRPRAEEPRVVDEPSPREASAKRKRPQTSGPAPAEEEDEAEGEVRRTRNRRGAGTGAYGDDFYYEDELEDGDESEPKRKKRKTPAKSAKR